MLRGNYAKISTETKQRILDAANSGEDFFILAKILNVNRSTAYNIVKRGRPNSLPKGNSNAKKIDDEIIEYAVTELEKMSFDIEGTQFKNRGAFSAEKTIYRPDTFSCFGLPMLYRETCRDSPAERNTPEFLEARREFAKWLMSPNIITMKKIYIDEFGCNIHTRRSQGRAKTGERAYRTVSGQKGPNITVYVAVSADQCLEHFEIITGGMTKAKFINFLQVVSGNFLLDNGLTSEGYCIFDNAPPHSNVENEEIPGLLSIKRLPKYSPMLTMVENAISAWKQGIKRSLSVRMHEFTKPAPAVVAGRTLTQYIIDKMSEINRETQGEVTIEKCRAWYDHTLTYIPDCLEKKLILG